MATAAVPREELERLPLDRDFTSAFALLPGVTDEARLGGLSVDGASGAENRFVIDGLDTTSLRSGTSGKGLLLDFVDRVQASVSGFGAEYPSATGGVLSAVTRSGTNTWRGSAGAYLTSSDLQGSARPTLRLKPTDATQAEYVTYPDDPWARWEPVVDLGGPIRRDRAWFYVGLGGSTMATHRDVLFARYGERATIRQTNRSITGQASLTARVSADLRVKLTFAPDSSRSRGMLPTVQPDGTSMSLPPSSYDYGRKGTDTWNRSYSASVDYVPLKRLAISVAAGLLQYDTSSPYLPDGPQYYNLGSNYGFPDIPESSRVQDRYSEGSPFLGTMKDRYQRVQANATASWFGTLGGEHLVKAGIQFQRPENAPVDGYMYPYVAIHWDASYAAADGSYVRGTYGYYEAMMQQDTGRVATNSLGLFAQDSWSVGRRLTISGGLRTERETVPSYRAENPGIHFGFADRLSPRVGFAVDVRGDGRWKAYGSWGRFFDQTKLELARTSLGGWRSFSGYYTLDTYDWRSIRCVPWEEGDCPGTQITLMDWAIPPNAADPRLQGMGLERAMEADLKPMESDELSLGVDHALSARTSVGVRFVHKRLLRAIEDIGLVVPDVGTVLLIVNPGEGSAGRLQGPNDPGLPKPVRNYDSIELSARRRLAGRWSLSATYAYTRLFGNYAGLASADENGRVAPNVTRAFDAACMAYDAAGHLVLGRMDRPHNLRAEATYDLPWGISVGAVGRVMSGTPEQKQLSLKGYPVFFEGRGSMGRTPVFSQVDLQLQENGRVFGRHRVTISLNVTNLFDQQTVTRRANTPWRDSFNLTDQQFFAGFDAYTVAASKNLRPNAQFSMASAWQARRTARLMVKYAF